RDWSSDVCSSDLAAPAPPRPAGGTGVRVATAERSRPLAAVVGAALARGELACGSLFDGALTSSVALAPRDSATLRSSVCRNEEVVRTPAGRGAENRGAGLAGLMSSSAGVSRKGAQPSMPLHQTSTSSWMRPLRSASVISESVISTVSSPLTFTKYLLSAPSARGRATVDAAAVESLADPRRAARRDPSPSSGIASQASSIERESSISRRVLPAEHKWFGGTPEPAPLALTRAPRRAARSPDEGSQGHDNSSPPAHAARGK